MENDVHYDILITSIAINLPWTLKSILIFYKMTTNVLFMLKTQLQFV